MKIRQVLFLFFIAINPFFSFGQETMGVYRSAVGIRFAEYSGLSVRQYINAKNAFDAHFLRVNNGLWFQLHWQNKRAIISEISNLDWFFGAGAHFGAHWESSYQFGPAANIGLDYTLTDIPISATLDCSPTIDFRSGGFKIGLGLVIRYILK